MVGRSDCRALAAALVLAAAPPSPAAAPLWQDRPLRIIQTGELHFPTSLAQQGVREGEVRAVVLVDATGQLGDLLVTGYTHREFVPELLSSLRQWKFEPALDRGEPRGVRTEVTFRFENRGNVVSLSAIDTLNVSINRVIAQEATSLVAKLSELDQMPTAIHIVHPLHPGRALQPAQSRGTAAIDFYIDGEGRPRMPVVARATHEAFAAAAIEALLQWRFAPPTAGGRATAVRVVQEFVFSDRP